ncbi:hypothetical protein [Pseudactinotalea sp. HY158]|nr:hypothetical protein [Pseudactinotalea sp. HY158]QGH68696.1 hypothetical protein GCE65_03670 [Pseudactinotalea sp. HY158]
MLEAPVRRYGFTMSSSGVGRNRVARRDTAGKHRPTGLEPLADNIPTEVI